MDGRCDYYYDGLIGDYYYDGVIGGYYYNGLFGGGYYGLLSGGGLGYIEEEMVWLRSKMYIIVEGEVYCFNFNLRDFFKEFEIRV